MFLFYELQEGFGTSGCYFWFLLLFWLLIETNVQLKMMSGGRTGNKKMMQSEIYSKVDLNSEKTFIKSHLSSTRTMLRLVIENVSAIHHCSHVISRSESVIAVHFDAMSSTKFKRILTSQLKVYCVLFLFLPKRSSSFRLLPDASHNWNGYLHSPLWTLSRRGALIGAVASPEKFLFGLSA